MPSSVLPCQCSTRRVLAALGALSLLGGGGAVVLPSRADPSFIFGFGCVQAAGKDFIGLGTIPAPSGNGVRNPSAVLPLMGSGLVPVARISSSMAIDAVDRRCTTLATRLTQLALATGNASRSGVVNLVNGLAPRKVGDQQVIAIDKGDGLASVGNGLTSQEALNLFGRRIQKVAARQVFANSLEDGDILVLDLVEIGR